MIETGELYKIKNGGFATVRFPRKIACDSCHMCLKPKEEMYVELNVKNSLNAKVGDKVVVEMQDKAIFSSSLLVYLIPLIVLCIVVAITYKYETWISIVSSISSLLITFIAIGLLDKFFISKRTKYNPRIIKIETLE